MRLILIDPTLRDQAGHNFDYARLVIRDARRAGLTPLVYAHRQARDGALDASLDAPVTPWFELGLKDEQRRLGALVRDVVRATAGEKVTGALRAARRTLAPPPADDHARALGARAVAFRRELEQALPSLDLSESDRLFFPGLTWPEALAAGEVCARTPVRDGETLIMLRFDPPEDAGARAQIARTAAALGARVRWLVDTQPLAAAFAPLLGAAPIVGPIPVDAALLQSFAPAVPLTIGYFGETRIEKGALLLPEIFAHALRDPRADGVRVVLQNLHNVVGGEAGIVASIAQVRALDDPRVLVLDGALAPARFTELLATASILLAPYAASAYRVRSSGLVAMALTAGLEIVAPRAPSWISATVAAEGADAFLYEDDSPSAIAEALLRAVDHVRRHGRRAGKTPLCAALPPPWVAP